MSDGRILFDDGTTKDKRVTNLAPLPVYLASGSTPGAAPSPPLSSPYSTANISVSSSGDNTLLAAVSAKTNKIYRIMLTFASLVDVALKDDTTVLGTYQGVLGIVMDMNTDGTPLFVNSAVNKAFNINLSSAVACKGTVWYINS